MTVDANYEKVRNSPLAMELSDEQSAILANLEHSATLRAIVREIHGILRRMNIQHVELSNYISKQLGRRNAW